MDSKEMLRIAESWIRLHESKQGSAGYEREFWSFEAIDELTHNSPHEAFDVIVTIARLCKNEKCLAYLGAGPIEDLMLYFGLEVIERVEAEAKGNSQFKKALKAV